MPDDDSSLVGQFGLAYLIEMDRPEADFKGDVIRGLSAHPPQIPPKYFYDETGADLFEKICTTPEYYVTRSETALLTSIAGDIADIIGPHANIFEPGSGAAEKIRILLRALEQPAEYCLFDISRDQMERVARDINREFSTLRVGAVAGDFTRPVPTSQRMFYGDGKRVCYFPGGTLGNFAPDTQIELLRTFRTPLRPGDGILLGVDKIKDTARLDAAYNDAAGYTRDFNMNLLSRMAGELGAELQLNDWEHLSFFDKEKGRIRMFLVAKAPTTISLEDHKFQFGTGDWIHTEDSWKFDEQRLRTLAGAAGLEVEKVWGLTRSDFLMAWLVVPA